MFSGINNYFTGKYIDVHYKAKTGSTNDDLKIMAKNGAKEGTLVICEHQTKGKGRLGKSFYSPENCGIYLSLLLKPVFSPENFVLITVAAAVAVRRAMLSIFKTDTKIKWVNDIYKDGKKFCGILTEATTDNNNGIMHCILGIGINVLTPKNGYPDEFAYKTTSLSEFVSDFPDDYKNKLVAKILSEFFLIYDNIEQKEFIKEYKDASCVIGKEIEILSGEHKGAATALDIDDDAHLIVRLKNGETAFLSSGDISIKL